MTLESVQQGDGYGIYKRYQINRIRKLLVKLKRPHAYNEVILGDKSRTQLSELIKNLKNEVKLI